MPGARVLVRNLRKTFRPVGVTGGVPIEVLRGIDLTLEAGEMVAVVGASGVGKSTFLQVLGTLDAPTSGSISFDGEDVTQLSPSRLADFRNKSIGFVFQFHHLLPEFTAVENVAMPAMIGGVSRSRAAVDASALLERVGLGHRLTHRPGELSGGEQQRVALARALILRPKLLLADEPTGNLDGKTGEAMHALFVELNREQGMTMLVVTHNPDLAHRMPRRLRMSDGGILHEDVPGAPLPSDAPESDEHVRGQTA